MLDTKINAILVMFELGLQLEKFWDVFVAMVKNLIRYIPQQHCPKVPSYFVTSHFCLEISLYNVGIGPCHHRLGILKNKENKYLLVSRLSNDVSFMYFHTCVELQVRWDIFSLLRFDIFFLCLLLLHWNFRFRFLIQTQRFQFCSKTRIIVITKTLKKKCPNTGS